MRVSTTKSNMPVANGFVASAFVAPVLTMMALATITLPAAVAQTAKREVPVRVGTDHPDHDACGAWAEVRGLKPGGDGFLAVRAGPAADFALRDKLREGDAFFVCAGSADGQWMSIVYPRKGQDAADCGVSSAVPQPRDYRGPCAYGWVHSRWVKVIAG